MYEVSHTQYVYFFMRKMMKKSFCWEKYSI